VADENGDPTEGEDIPDRVTAPPGETSGRGRQAQDTFSLHFLSPLTRLQSRVKTLSTPLTPISDSGALTRLTHPLSTRSQENP
jgi:hypothetical protein